MLRKLNRDEYVQYPDSAYELALDLGRSCYPTYGDGLKTRQNFDEAEALEEIFGVGFEDRRFDSGVFRALNRAKTGGMKDMAFFHGNELHPTVESIGIRTADTYFGYQFAL